MREDADDISHVITIGEDVTEWRRAQRRLAETEKLAAVGQLAAGVMHEINNPLATILACTEALGLRAGERSEEHTSELQSRLHLVCRLLLEKKKNNDQQYL